MTNEILIGLGGLILSVLTYFAGVRRTERRHAHEDREARIRHVFDRYMEFRRTNRTAGLDGLQKAGAATLVSDAEVREVARMIVAHGEKNPLGGDAEKYLGTTDLSRFFRYASDNAVDFFHTRVDDAVRDFNTRT